MEWEKRHREKNQLRKRKRECSFSEQAISQSVRALMCRKISFDFISQHIYCLFLAINVCSAAIALGSCTLVVASKINFCFLLLSNRKRKQCSTILSNNYEEKQIAIAKHELRGEKMVCSPLDAHWHSHDVISILTMIMPFLQVQHARSISRMWYERLPKIKLCFIKENKIQQLWMRWEERLLTRE